jgi:ribosomal protein S18 acetylase RimI-like enzyme
MAREDQTGLWRSIRLATAADAAELAEIRSATRNGRGEADSQLARRDELDFLNRLALPHGDDYFCIVAEADDHVVGYLIGGGSRDLDRKAHAEIYELAVLPDFQRQGVGGSLLSDAFARFDTAAFAGTLLSAPASDEATERLATRLEMRPDHLDGEIVRYERALPSTRNRETP